MDGIISVYAIAGVILAYFLFQVMSKRFDPFAPTWLVFVGYIQIYVVQALMYHDWAVLSRGADLVSSANFRALWAIIWFLLAYHLGAGRWLVSALPKPPSGWSPGFVMAIAPLLVLWGLYSSGVVISAGSESAEESLIRSFPFVMMVAATMLIVTGRSLAKPRPLVTFMGVMTGTLYILIWMFNGKRSHSLMGVLVIVCAMYTTRLKRPSWGVLAGTAFTGALVVAIAISWRLDTNHDRSVPGFVEFLTDFPLSNILTSMNVVEDEEESKETKEYGGFLLMMDTVPMKSEYDWGANYLRTVSTFIPRVIWTTKPLYGRSQWISAWIAGSLEGKRDETFAGPAIGILGATQLNGGVPGTIVVLAVLGTLLRLAYEYYRAYEHIAWVQFWWSITYYNAWFMVVTDDPMIWFYYNWGFSTFPIVILMWWVSKFSRQSVASVGMIHEGSFR